MTTDKSSICWLVKSALRMMLAVSWMMLCACTPTRSGISSGILADTSDICYTQRQALGQSNAYFSRDILIGAGAGAATGILGAMLSGHRDWQSVLIGAGTGAAVGALGGYFVAKQKQNADARTLANSVHADIIADNAQIDSASLAFAHLRECRFNAAKQVKDGYAAGRMSRDEAVRRLNDLQRRFNQDLTLARDMDVRMSKRGQEFEYASDRLLDQDPQAREILARSTPPPKPKASAKSGKSGKSRRKSAAKPEPVPETHARTSQNSTVTVAEASKSNLNKRQAFEQDIDQANRQATTAFSLSGEIGLIWPPPAAAV